MLELHYICIVALLWLQYKHFKKMVERKEDEDIDEVWNRYLKKMEKVKDDIKWGDQHTLQALSDKLGIKIDVIKVGHTQSIEPSEGPVNGEIHLGLRGESHYYSLERSEYSLIQRKNISMPLLAD